MRNYVLTERGKFLVVTIVAFFLIVLSLVLAVLSLLREAPELPPENNQNGTDVTDPSSNLVDFNLNAGVMTFLFSPGQQSALDENIISLIAELLNSPQNTAEAKIAVEIPQLGDENTAVITNAVIAALEALEVSINDITFFVYMIETKTEDYEINISFRD
ncbi:MAG: hypothetical protein FWD44_06675 [Oscillospiraceae bacterium]|nr:hypothetical protein [Oscillospiraceae bacterium]